MQNGATIGLASGAVAVLAFNNISKHNDPVPQLFIGGLTVVMFAFIAALSPQLGFWLALLFFVSVFLTKSDAFLNFFVKGK